MYPSATRIDISCTRSGLGRCSRDLTSSSGNSFCSLQLLRQPGLDILQFPHRQFRRVEPARNLAIEIPANHAAERNRQHDPESHAGKSAELEGGVQGDDEGRGQSQQHMNVQPVFGTALPGKPWPLLAQGINKNGQKHGQSHEAKFYPDHSTGPQEVVLGREWALGGAKGVVVKAVNGQAYYQGDGNHIAADQADVMCPLPVPGGYGSGCDGGVCTHWFATCSSVSTENLL